MVQIVEVVEFQHHVFGNGEVVEFQVGHQGTALLLQQIRRADQLRQYPQLGRKRNAPTIRLQITQQFLSPNRQLQDHLFALFGVDELMGEEVVVDEGELELAGEGGEELVGFFDCGVPADLDLDVYPACAVFVYFADVSRHLLLSHHANVST